MKTTALIMAGGKGERFWPKSRVNMPKQFLSLTDDGKTMIQLTVERISPLVDIKDVYIATNKNYRELVKQQLPGIPEENILCEPVGRNTAPCVGLGAVHVASKYDDAVMIVLPSDHLIKHNDIFKDTFVNACEVAESGANLVTVGITPNYPETGYGYIEAGEPDGAAFVVESFKEKPDLATAERYVAAGNYYWNSGMFAFTIDFMKGEMAKYQPEIAAILAEGYDSAVAHFADMPEISIDYAIAERSQAVRMVPLTCYWNDIGSWDAMYDILPHDADGNAVQGDVLALDCKDSLIMGHDRHIAGIGLDDLLLVETDDVIVVARKGASQQVKTVVEKLKKMGRKEAVEHTTMYHRWGTSTVIGQGVGYRMKKVRVMPGKAIAMQMHYHRTEHWVVLRGTAEVTRGEERTMLHERESIFIPQTTKHQLKNPGRIPLEIIEIQNGSYIGEDDIVRYE